MTVDREALKWRVNNLAEGPLRPARDELRTLRDNVLSLLAELEAAGEANDAATAALQVWVDRCLNAEAERDQFRVELGRIKAWSGNYKTEPKSMLRITMKTINEAARRILDKEE